MTSGFVTSKSSAASVVCLVVLCMLLMGAVLAFGAVDTWATSVLDVSAVLLLGVWAVCRGQSVVGQRLKWNPLYPPMLAFGALVCAQIALNLTVYRYATLLAGLQYVAFSALLLLAVQVTGDERSSKIFLLTLGLFGFAVAIFAICQNLSAPGTLYWIRTPLSGAVFGPYVNHNHYAGVMEMLTPLALVLSLSRLVHGAQRMLAAFAVVLMAGSIILSGSRSGTFSLIVEFGFLFWIASQARRRTGLRHGLLLLVFCLLGFLAWVGSGDLWHHLGDLQDANRLAILKDGLRMSRLKPIFGWGLGTFPTAYPAFRSFYTSLFVNAAHNDYLQALVETGAVGFACAVWFITVLYRQAFKQITNWTHHWNGALRVATLSGCTGLLVHSAFDFNLQIPANAALFCVLCAISTNFSGPLNEKPSARRSVTGSASEPNFYPGQAQRSGAGTIVAPTTQ